MFENLKEIIQSNFSFTPNKNQLIDLKRLIYEIIRRENTNLDEVISYLKSNSCINKFAGRNRFFALKEALIKRRFPQTSSQQKIDTKKVFLTDIPTPLQENWKPAKNFYPLKIYVEEEVKDSWLFKNFKEKFPQAPIQIIDSYSNYIKENKFSLSILKMPQVFIIKEKSDFLKPCPCTKQHIRCGYWILNVGFGCPFDCSYCFLQHYTNSPGIVLPANLEDFFYKFDDFVKKLKYPIRIGTGEFCDSLALDHITEYSKKLIPYFSQKSVFFELKTKSSNIKNLLEQKPSKNIIISWSVNPQSLIDTEEIATSSLNERLMAAKQIQEFGYSVALHLDPIILVDDWQNLYKELINQIYSYIKPPVAWISLGTLRSNRQLKTIVEQRFPQNQIFYGELLIGEDKKLRYPKFLRYQAYKSILGWIKEFDTKTPVYLCMEDIDLWKELFSDELNLNAIEHYLVKSLI